MAAPGYIRLFLAYTEGAFRSILSAYISGIVNTERDEAADAKRLREVSILGYIEVVFGLYLVHVEIVHRGIFLILSETSPWMPSGSTMHTTANPAPISAITI